MADAVRDAKADYVKALLEEYESYKRANMADRADAVAAELRKYGHEVKPRPAAGVKERAVASEPLEKAVEADEAPKRGRPKKAE